MDTVCISKSDFNKLAVLLTRKNSQGCGAMKNYHCRWPHDLAIAFSKAAGADKVAAPT
jgi:hypothetical protein